MRPIKEKIEEAQTNEDRATVLFLQVERLLKRGWKRKLLTRGKGCRRSKAKLHAVAVVAPFEQAMKASLWISQKSIH